MQNTNKDLLLIGASRGLGLALAKEYVNRGWHVVATNRSASTKTALNELAEMSGGKLKIGIAEINRLNRASALRTRLGARRFDMLLVNAGVKNDDRETIA